MQNRLNCFRDLFVSVFWCMFVGAISAQGSMTELDHDLQQRYDRMVILSGGGPPLLHTSIQPYFRKDLVSLADSFYHLAVTARSLQDVRKTWNENNEFARTDSIFSDPHTGFSANRYQRSVRPLWHTFYRTPEYLFEVDVPDFYLRVNPMFNISLGREFDEGATTYANQRGISLRGGIGNSVYFQTSFYDSQVRFPNYINQYTDTFGVVPGAALFKDFHSKLLRVDGGRDFLLASAYAGVHAGKYFDIQLGHNTFFLGDGIRSLFISDFSTPYFSLKINTRIWKFQYQNIFAELAADNFRASTGTSDPIPKKYLTAHYLTFKASPTVSFGLFEAVVFDRPGHRFELQYLNPVILYRTVEGAIGSPDNVLLGLSTRVDLWKRVSAYGQFILDDISVAEIFNGHLDWWGNKFGFQLGAKYVNAFGVDHLDVQAEWNQVRPYTFSHYDEHGNYSHYKQVLAHPLGANFNEFILSGAWCFSPRGAIRAAMYVAGVGDDPDTVSYGSVVIKPNTTRQGDYGNHIAQGVKGHIFYGSFRVQYELVTSLMLDLGFIYRNKTSDDPRFALMTKQALIGLRYNFPYRRDVF